MRAAFTFPFLLCFTLLTAQPKMTLWRVQNDHNLNNQSAISHEAEEYACGAYYFFVSDGVAESTWSIKNEGTSNLELRLPLGFDPNSATSMEINLQPSKAILAPGEETHFKIQYDFYGVHGDFFLDIESNDPVNGSCGLLVGGNVLACTCYCVPQSVVELDLTSSDVSGVQQNRGICSKTIGAAAGIPLSDMPCDPVVTAVNTTGIGPAAAVGDACNPITIADPCSCDNTITVGGQLLYRDTLTVTTTPGSTLTLSDNDLGFLDNTGSPIMAGTTLGVGDATGVVAFVFYRNPGEGLNIRVNGLPFITANICPDANLCDTMVADPIPTMGQWTLVCLALFILIFSVVAIRIKNKEIVSS